MLSIRLCGITMIATVVNNQTSAALKLVRTASLNSE